MGYHSLRPRAARAELYSERRRWKEPPRASSVTEISDIDSLRRKNDRRTLPVTIMMTLGTVSFNR